jgi:hypothetical protein
LVGATLVLQVLGNFPDPILSNSSVTLVGVGKEGVLDAQRQVRELLKYKEENSMARTEIRVLQEKLAAKEDEIAHKQRVGIHDQEEKKHNKLSRLSPSSIYRFPFLSAFLPLLSLVFSPLPPEYTSTSTSSLVGGVDSLSVIGRGVGLLDVTVGRVRRGPLLLNSVIPR